MNALISTLLFLSSLALANTHSDPSLDPSKSKHALPPSAMSQRSVAFSAVPLAQTRQFLNHSMPDFALPDLAYGSPQLPSYEYFLKKPSVFNLLKLNSKKRTPSAANGPTLVNSDYEYLGISDREFGYCWGFATLIRNFAYLAFFDKNFNDSSMPDPVHAHQAWLKYYYQRFDQVLTGNATVIPGFSNIRELTSVPEFELYLKMASMFLWKTRALQASSLPIFFNATKLMTKVELDATTEKLKTKLARGEFPKILFSSAVATRNILGGSGDIHAVLIHRVDQTPNGSTRIHLWDVNFYAEDIAEHDLYLEISPTGQVTYAPWYSEKDPANSMRIARIELTAEDELETAMILTSLKKFCANKNPRCSN